VVTITAQQILEGTYNYPKEFDQATKEICQECIRIRLMVPKDWLNLAIPKEDWKRQWKGQRESMSSSETGLHFGQYIAGCDLDHIAHFHALKATVAKREIVMDR
jgi:hypothetical protein